MKIKCEQIVLDYWLSGKINMRVKDKCLKYISNTDENDWLLKNIVQEPDSLICMNDEIDNIELVLKSLDIETQKKLINWSIEDNGLSRKEAEISFEKIINEIYRN